MTEEID